MVPLIILGLIIVLGGALLIYYQLGPKVTLRLKSSLGGFGAGIFGGGEAPAPEAAEAEVVQEGAAEVDSEQVAPEINISEAGKKSADNEGKVLFIFGDGETEVRPIREDGEKDE